MAADPRISTKEAAGRLETSVPTVLRLIETRKLRAAKEPWGKRFRWAVDAQSVDDYLRGAGPFGHRRRAGRSLASRVARLEQHVAAMSARATSPAVVDVERERDELRAQVVNLREALARTREVAELQEQCDAGRAKIVEHLLAATAAAEEVDALRRRAVEHLNEALATFTAPGHLGDIH